MLGGGYREVIIFDFFIMNFHSDDLLKIKDSFKE